MTKNQRTLLLLPAVCLLLGACVTQSALERSREAFSTSDPLQALQGLKAEVASDPGNQALRAYLIRQSELLTTERLALADRARLAGRLPEAEKLYAEAMEIDPQNPRARAGLDQVKADYRSQARLDEAQRHIVRGELAPAETIIRAVLAEQPGNALAREMLRTVEDRKAPAHAPAVGKLEGELAKPVTLEFRDAPLRVVFEALARASKLNFVFDRDVRAESKVTMFVRDNSVGDVLRLIGATQQLGHKVLNGNSVLIYPATPAKHKEYLELVTRTFFLSNAEAKQAMALLRQVVKTRDIFVDEKLNMLVIKDTPQAVLMAERLLASLDVADPEVMLEVEVLEVSRNRLTDLGIEFPTQIGYGLIQPGLSTTTIVNGVTQTTQSPGGTLAAGVVNLRNHEALVPYVSNPAAILKLRNEDGDSSLLANPRIRVKNREKAKIHIGEKLPVFTTTSTANVGVSASVNYLDVGLKLDVEPNVTLEDDVVMKVALEVSSIVKEVPGPSSSLAYQVGTRSAATTLRLANGETQVLAGLINDEERSSASRLPGLGQLPVLGRLFSAERGNTSKTEVVLLITPRILRNIVPPPAARTEQSAGTEASVGAGPLRIGPSAPNGLSLSGGARGAPVSTVEPGLASGGSEEAAPDASASDTPDTQDAEASPDAPDVATEQPQNEGDTPVQAPDGTPAAGAAPAR